VSAFEAVVAALAVGLTIYLFVALLWPEKFE
jgi:K+-transporting ATPase KdpF subunit